MGMSDLVYCIGVDHREPEAYAVAENSAVSFASKPLDVIPLEHMELRRRQMFDRPWRIDEMGGYWDERDGKPFSVQFSHTRFLAPLVAREDSNADWALFTDCDWMFMDDVFKMLKEADSSKTVMVVPHQFAPTKTAKMDGQKQTSYQRKMWSALMLWNLNSKKLPTIEMVNQADGGYLHRFGWLDDSDIGFLSESWHWIPNYSPTTEVAKANEEAGRATPINGVHFTYGPPAVGMVNRELTGFDQLWRNEMITAMRKKY